MSWIGCSLLGASLVLPAAPIDEELYLCFPHLEVTADEPASGGETWTSLSIGTPTEPTTAWRQARVEFELPGPPENGSWLLRLGEPGLQVRARLNDFELKPSPDPFGEGAALVSGSRFDIPSETLTAGRNQLEFYFEGVEGGRDLAHGPAYLLSPGPAQALRRLTETSPGSFPIGNFATRASASSTGRIGRRIQFRSARHGGEFRMLAQVSVSVAVPGTPFLDFNDLERSRGALTFPMPTAVLGDSRLGSLEIRQRSFAPLDIAHPEVACLPAMICEIRNPVKPKASVDCSYTLRLFPGTGGPLRAQEFGGVILIYNESIGMFVSGGRLLGTPEQPLGVHLEVAQMLMEGPESRMSMAGPSFRYGVFLEQTSQQDPAVRMAERARLLVRSREDFERAARELGKNMVRGPDLIPKVPSGLLSRKAGAYTLAAMRPTGDGSFGALVRGRGVHSSAAFFEGAFGLLHLTANERAMVRWLCATQDSEGAIRAELPATASDLDLLEADVFAVLRAARLYHWTYDGTLLEEIEPKLLRALDHAHELVGDDLEGLRSLASTANDAPPPTLLAVALVAAGRELASALQEAGKREPAEALRARAEALHTRLFRSEGEGGCWAGSHLRLHVDEDPGAQAAGLLLGVYPPAAARSYCERLQQIAEASPEAVDGRFLRVTRILLEQGSLPQGTARVLRATEALALAEGPAQGKFGGYYDMIVYGLLGIERVDLGTLAVRTRLSPAQKLNTAIPVPEGTLNLHLGEADLRHERNLRARNLTDEPFMLEVAFPSGYGDETIEVGGLRLSLNREVLEPGGNWQRKIR